MSSWTRKSAVLPRESLGAKQATVGTTISQVSCAYMEISYMSSVKAEFLTPKQQLASDLVVFALGSNGGLLAFTRSTSPTLQLHYAENPCQQDKSREKKIAEGSARAYRQQQVKRIDFLFLFLFFFWLAGERANVAHV